MKQLPTTREYVSAQRRGSGMIEMIIAVTLFSIVMLSAMEMIQSGSRFSRTTLATTAVEDLSQAMLYRFERELADATAEETAKATLAVDLDEDETDAIELDSTLAFPPFGTLVIDPGGADPERVAYAALDPDQIHLNTLTRGIGCTQAAKHLAQTTDVYWSGYAEWIGDQQNPAPGDRVTQEEGVDVFFRGDGTGFSYRVPIDPAGGQNPLNGNDLFWGAEVPGVGPTLDGWMCFYFLPKTTFSEPERNFDLNGDGDQQDLFDVGQVRRLAWDVTDPTRREDVGFGPSSVLQERCNWGGDLDNDGYADPLFLWNPTSRVLHIRVTLLGDSAGGLPITRKVESYTFLRNKPEGIGNP